MNKKILILGGAGFIGQHLTRALLKAGNTVRILDNFSEQVHIIKTLPFDLYENVDLIRGDIRDRNLMRQALIGIDSVVNLAAETGTGQSMYEIERYFSVNVQGTAILIDLLQNDDVGHSVQSVVIASSRAVYGEGAYRCDNHGMIFPSQRTKSLMSNGYFEPLCPVCGCSVFLIPTPESAPFMPTSMYGLTKQVQEQAVLLFANTRGINGFGLRYQNVYGPGQSLKNPYTGILAVFSNLARQNHSIEIYEDGKESRDFVYIDDVVDATIRCINHTGKFVGPLNVGSGHSTSVMTVAEEIKSFFKSESKITTTGKFRMGDIRHNKADLNLVEKVLGFEPAISFKQGLSNFLGWASLQEHEDAASYLRSVAELSSKGLMGAHFIESND